MDKVGGVKNLLPGRSESVILLLCKEKIAMLDG